MRIFGFIAAIASLCIFLNYHFLLSKKESEAVEDAKKVEAILNENFEEVEKVLVFIGKKIASETPDLNLKIIHKIFTQTSNIQGSNNIFSWSLFDWVGSNGLQTVNTMFGINEVNPPDMSDRYYALRNSDQWVMLFSKVTIGNPSEMSVIPIGVQITTSKKPLAGTVVVGVNVKKLVNAIESKLDGGSKFMIIDKRNQKFIFGGYESEKFLGRKFNKIPDLVDGERYVYSKEMMEKYPYEIFIGYNENKFWSEIFYSSALLLFQIMSISAFILLLMRGQNRK